MSRYKSLKYGMVGGGQGAFIGDVHRKAVEFDNLCELVAGAFSRDIDNTRQTAAQFGVSSDRAYKSFEDMAEKESLRADGIDFVIIVTPNNTHFAASKAFLEKGIPVVCDKPLTITVKEALELEMLAAEKDLLFAVTYLNQGYDMVKQARAMIAEGELGELRMVMGEYPQGWLATPVEKEGAKVAWRVDPQYSGVSASVADIGSHLENVIAYITGLKIKKVCAKLDIIGEDRKLDTNGSILVEYDSGITGMYWCSQIAIGSDNALRVRIIGSKGTIEWAQEDPNSMRFTPLNGPTQIYSKGNAYINEEGMKYNRIPAGHPVGTYEAFANIYLGFCEALLKMKAGETLTEADKDYPDVADGVASMKFIHACVNSQKNGSAWVEL